MTQAKSPCLQNTEKTHQERSFNTAMSHVLVGESSALAKLWKIVRSLGVATCSGNLNRPLSPSLAPSLGRQKVPNQNSPSTNQRLHLFWEAEETPSAAGAKSADQEKWSHCMSDLSLMHESTVDIRLTAREVFVFNQIRKRTQMMFLLAPKKIYAANIKLFHPFAS